FPHSLGLLYSAFTYYIGFKVNSGEYKLMGLAPYGNPRYVDLIKEKLIKVADDGSFQMDMSYFNYPVGLTMTSKKFNNLFGGSPRKPEVKITQRDMDLAASVQKVIEDIIVQLAKGIVKDTGERNLCLAGGVALNCVVNGILLREKLFENIWIQPAAGDAGGALGAALSAWYLHHGQLRTLAKSGDSMKGAYLGPKFSDEQIESELDACGARYKKLMEQELIEETATALASGKAVAWMQGRMEFGPRALGARSIIADPRSPIMQKQLNLKVKYRESFRPFAPSVLEKHASKWFDLEVDSPYMLFVCNIRENIRCKITEEERALFGIEKLNVIRSSVPAITHVDCSARVQTVHKDTNFRYHALLNRFFEKTGCPIIINTSFNVRGEPIVCTPTDAFRCFMATELDTLSVGNYILFKEEQNQALKNKNHESYDPD
ncbi:MAG: carbamoyltransferase, partial [Paracoccaceae bacterium]